MTVSVAFHAFRPELLAHLHGLQPRPMSEIVIRGTQHQTNLGQLVAEQDELRMFGLRVLLKDYTDANGRTERRLVAYALDEKGRRSQRIGLPPKDGPRSVNYLATLHRPEGKRRLEGKLSLLKAQSRRKGVK